MMMVSWPAGMQLESFFPLTSQFQTEVEPVYCGLTTLCVILNALEIDPGRNWNAPWRFFGEEMGNG